MELAAFLLAAKAATYAAQGDGASVTPLLSGSKQLEYRAGALLYRDIYFGMNRFVGQELVYRDGNPLWSMGYAGGLVADADSALAAPVYAHLRKALLGASPALPLRGPAVLDDGHLRYTCQSEGALDAFHGVERITLDGRLVYTLHFCGGRLA